MSSDEEEPDSCSAGAGAAAAPGSSSTGEVKEPSDVRESQGVSTGSIDPSEFWRDRDRPSSSTAASRAVLPLQLPLPLLSSSATLKSSRKVVGM